MGDQAQVADGGASLLAGFIQSRRGEILGAWEHLARGMPSARHLPRLVLSERVPALLDRLAERGDDGAGLDGEALLDPAAADPLATARFDDDFDLAEVVGEYEKLRECLLDIWRRHVGVDPAAAHFADLLHFNRAIDSEVLRVIRRYNEARDRRMKALDKASTSALESRDLDEFLPWLLQVIVDASPDVDTATVLLKEGDLLRVRASIGLEEEVARGFTLPIGEGFAGKVARERRPHVLASAFAHTLVVSEHIRRRGVRALYGVPLVHDQELLGVAHIGSLTVSGFSEADRRLFEALARRAGIGVYQHLVHRAAEQRAAELEAVLQSIPDAIYVGDEGGIKRANAASLELLGFSSLEELNQNIPRLCEMLDARIAVTSEPLPPQELAFTRALRGDATAQEILIRHRRSGQTRVIRSAAAPVIVDGHITGAVAVNSDITEQRQADARTRFLADVSQQLSESIETQSTLRRVAQLAVPRIADWCVAAIVDEVGAVRVAVEGPDAELSLARRDELERSAVQLDDSCGLGKVLRTGEPELIVDARPLCEAPADGLTPGMRFLRERGLRSYMAVPLKKRGRILGAVSFAITRAGRSLGPGDLAFAKELAHRAAYAIDNARLYEEAREATRSRQNILAVVSHDLKNPLSAILMSTALLVRRAGEDPAWRALRRTAETIHRTAERMNRLLHDLVDLASIEGSRLAIERAACDAVALLEEAVETLQPLADEKVLRLECEVVGAPPPLDCDKDRVLQVLTNLVGNAVKATPEGGSINLRVAQRGHEVVFAVSDTGRGIAEDELPHLFQPYWRGRSADYTGSGLGLAIAQGIVEAHGGRIWAESEVGVGSTFYFTLPVPGDNP